MIFRRKRKTATPGKAMEPPTPFPEFAGLTADDRARSLLLSMLTKDELAQFKLHGYFDVVVKSGRRYRLYNGGVLLMKNHGNNYLCVYPWDSMTEQAPPPHDRMLGCMLYIKADEIAFLKIARGHNERV